MDEASPRYTCLTCSVGFTNLSIQKEHYQSAWHIYNLKRKVAGLGHVSAQGFKERVQVAGGGVPVGGTSTAATAWLGQCRICERKYKSEKVFRQHLDGKRHQELRSLLDDKDLEIADLPLILDKAKSGSRSTLVVDGDDDSTAVDAKIDQVLEGRKKLPRFACLFCSSPSFDDIDAQLAHMRTSHSFVLPEEEYLIDRPGLMDYLADKVSLGFVCLWCNGRGRSFHSLEAVWKHMEDRGHQKLAYDDEESRLELSDFYDFTSSYPQAEGGEDDDNEGEDDGWEEVDEEMGSDVDDGSTPVIEIDMTGRRPKPLSRPAMRDPDTMELVLGSNGARLGHRSLARYYKQNLSSPAYLAGGSGAEIGAMEIDDGGVDGEAGAMTVAKTRLERRAPISTSGNILDEDLLRKGFLPLRRGEPKEARGPLPTNSLALQRLKRDRRAPAQADLEHAPQQVMKARNAGEARHAFEPVQSHREQRGQLAKRNEISMRRQGNYQKHFRDHLLQ